MQYTVTDGSTDRPTEFLLNTAHIAKQHAKWIISTSAKNILQRCLNNRHCQACQTCVSSSQTVRYVTSDVRLTNTSELTITSAVTLPSDLSQWQHDNKHYGWTWSSAISHSWQSYPVSASVPNICWYCVLYELHSDRDIMLPDCIR